MHDLPPATRPGTRRPAHPYLDWALATGFRYLREGKWIPLLIEFNAAEARSAAANARLTALEAFATRRWLAANPQTLDDKFIIPQLFARAPAVLQRAPELNFCIALVRRKVDVVQQLMRSSGWNRTIIRVDLGPPVDFVTPSTGACCGWRSICGAICSAIGRMIARVRAWMGKRGSSPRAGASAQAPNVSLTPPGSGIPTTPGPGSPPPPPSPGSSSPSGLTGASGPNQVDRVVIAVIDQGIAFANARFFSANTARIEYLWQQNVLGTTVPAAALTMSTTPGYELGRVAIESAANAGRAIGAGDEWVYRNYGGLSFSVDGYKPLAHRRTHGTHVLDLAASVSNPARHPIIAVDMPEDAVGDPAGSTLSVQAAWGLIYILDRTERLRQPNETLPVVANVSYGPHEGPHDGTSIFEAFMDAIYAAANTTRTPIEIVLAAGNFRQTRTHAAFSLARGKTKTLQWRLQPGGLTPSLMEIWLPQGLGRDVTVTLTPPNISATLTPITVSTNANLTNEVPANAPPGSVLYQARYVVPAPGSGNADSIVLSIAPTAPDPGGSLGQPVVPSGVWTVTVHAATRTRGIHAWIRRSDTPSGRRARGRQSYFDDPRYQRFASNGRPHDYGPTGATSYVRRMQTLSGITTGGAPRIIGGYRNSDAYPARYSSHGTRMQGGAPTGPDWLECSDDSDVLRGVHAAGTQSESVVAMNGTSVAAPQATRWIAEAWLNGARPGFRPGLLPIALHPERPVPSTELPFAVGNGRARFTPRRPPRR